MINSKNSHSRRSLLRQFFGIGIAVAVPLASTSRALAQSTVNSDELGLLVIMNSDIDMPSIDDQELRRLFLGISRRLPNGARAALAAYEPESSFFNSRVLGRSDAEVSAIWSRLRFSGRTPPPRILNTASEVLRYVQATPNALAYLPANASYRGVRVIANVPRSTPPLTQNRR